MDRFTKMLQYLIVRLSGIGAFFLAIVMLLIFANIAVRPFGKIVPGSYETVELFIVITIAFSLALTGLHKGHVRVDLIIKRFPGRIQNIIDTFNWLVCAIFWGVTGVFAFVIGFEKGWSEISDYFRLPYLPFRIVFGIGMLLLALVFLVYTIDALKRSFKG